MGYEVNIELRNVKFEKKDANTVKEILKKYNKEVLIPKSSYGRFSNSLDNLEEIFEEIGYECLEYRNHFHVTEFNHEKLGGDQEMWVLLAPYLWDCEIVYVGEDDSAWKQTIKDGQVTLTHREEL